jgi:hypothetical protein
MVPDDRQLRIDECQRFTRYLVGQPASAELARRYAEADAALSPGPHAPSDHAMVRFVRRHPACLPYLDAACAVFRPQCLLRRKLLLTVAILEATPDFTRCFIHEGGSMGRALLQLAAIGVRGAFKFAVGCMLYPLAVSGR